MERLKKGIQNIDKVAKAVTKRAMGIGKEEAERREEICSTCTHNVPDKIFGGTMCDLCLCPIKNLIYSDKNCEIDKW